MTTNANPSPVCEVKDGAGSYQSSAGGVNVTPGNTVTIRLANSLFADAWLIECITTDETSDADVVTASLVIDALAKTATFTAPGVGKAYRFRSRVNGGVDRNGVARSSYQTTFCIYTTINNRRVSAADETTETDSVFGWVRWHNHVIRSIPVGSGTTWSGGGGGASGAFVPSGTGFVHVTASSQDSAAKLVENSDVATGAAISSAKVAATGSNGQLMFNGSGAFAAIPQLTWSGIQKALSVEGAVRFGNALVPSNIASGGAMYVISGALHWFGGSGTITLLAPA